MYPSTANIITIMPIVLIAVSMWLSLVLALEVLHPSDVIFNPDTCAVPAVGASVMGFPRQRLKLCRQFGNKLQLFVGGLQESPPAAFNLAALGVTIALARQIRAWQRLPVAHP